MKVVIIARTRQGSGDCVDAVTFDGRALRLIAADDASDSRPNPGYEIGEVWEIEAAPEENPVPPHVENRVLTAKRRLGSLSGLDQFVDDRCPPVRGGIDALFDGLTQPNGTGALYIAERSGIPGQSVMFWRPDRPLPRDQHAGRIRYRYLNETGGHTLAFIGFQEPLEEIPAGTLLRVSLAQWWRPALHPETEARCYVQLSGWILPEGPDGSPIHPIDPGHSRARPVIEPPWELLEEEIDPELPPPAIQGPAGRTGADIDLTHTLREVFGFPAFRPLQHEIIRNLMDRRDTLAVMPTGSGKSLCYQLPALLQPGLTVVASPLISLMEDQVVQLREWGIPAVYLNSSLDYGAYLEATRAVRSGETRLVYAAPETLVRQETILLLEKTGVDLFVIDEAHCISEWGHDFRPEYRRLAEVRGRLSDSVTLAVTATATDRVRADIMESLDIRGANLFIGSFDRPNLHLDVKDKLGGFEQARNFLEGHRGEAGIVYCATRNMVDDLAAELAAQGYPALPYHAGMSAVDRRRNQHRFRYEEGLIVVATIAFGMGIDKPDVRFVLHFDLPKNLESYYQQIGRAGRDGLPADCLLLYSYSDVHTIRYFMPADDPERRRQEEARLKTFLSFVEATGCRRPALLDYFGETYPQARCGNCDRCEYRQALESGPGDETGSGPSRTDLAEPARWFLETARLTNEIFGAAHLIDILRGSRAKKVLDKKHDRVKTYGIGSVFSKEHWRLLSGVFLREGLVRRTPPHGSLKITDRGEAVLAGGEFVTTHPDAAVHSAHAGSGRRWRASWPSRRTSSFTIAAWPRWPPGCRRTSGRWQGYMGSAGARSSSTGSGFFP